MKKSKQWLLLFFRDRLCGNGGIYGGELSD